MFNLDLTKVNFLTKAILPKKIPIVIVSKDTAIPFGEGGISPEPKLEPIKNLAGDLGLTIKREGKIVPMIAIDILKGDLPTFQSLANVKEIWFDFQIFNQGDRALEVSKIPQVRSKYNLSGEGEIVYVLDQGMDLNHSAIKNNIVGHTDLVGENQFCKVPDENHSTHVGGIIASNNPEYPGVAPNCKLYSIKILNSKGSGEMSTIIEGIDEALRLGAKIGNASVGGSNPFCYGTCPVCESINRAANQGLTMIVSAGNYGFMPYTITCPTKPEKSLSIGACDDNKNLAYWSSRSGLGQVNKPDFVTAGVDIKSASAGGGSIIMSGTSMSAPNLSGQVALIRERARILNLELNPIIIRKILLESATGGIMYISGKGVIDLDQAIEILNNVSDLGSTFNQG